MPATHRGAYALADLSTDELVKAYNRTNKLRWKYNGETGDLLPVGQRVRVRSDVFTARAGEEGALVEACGKTHPYSVRFDDGVIKCGYAGWELEVVDVRDRATGEGDTSS